jgi:Fe-Mn family superoxide dismutase
MNRRDFLFTSLLASAALATPLAGFELLGSAQAEPGGITLPPLPYSENALEPHISARTLSFHYGKHHKAYLDNTLNLIKGSQFINMSLEQIIADTAGKSQFAPIFNNAAQVFNHNFYWQSLKAQGGGQPRGKLLEKILADFGSFEKFREAFSQAGLSQFGSGWVWLVWDLGTLRIVKSANAENPLSSKQMPLLVLDVWEHAYYLDYQNRRKDYLNACLNHLLNWDFAQSNLAAIKG